MSRSPFIAVTVCLALAAGCAQSIESPPLVVGVRDYSGPRAEGFLPGSEVQAIAVETGPIIVEPRRARQAEEGTQAPAQVPAQGMAPEQRSDGGTLWITSTRQGPITTHSGDVSGTSVHRGGRSVHLVNGQVGVSHQVGRTTITNFGDATVTSTQRGSSTLHRVSDGAVGTTTRFGNQSTTTFDR